MNGLRLSIGAFVLLVSAGTTSAQENSGFLSDYSVLKASSEAGNVLLFIKDGAVERLAQFDSMLVDQPELFIDPDSKYKGMKPDTMTDLAETIRSSVIEGLGESFGIADAPGEGVLYLRLAAGKLYILKEKRGILGYTPIGAVAHGVKNAASDFVDKNTLVEMTLEVEIQDSTSGEVLAAALMSRGQRKDKHKDIEQDAVNWDRLEFAFRALGQRLGCRLNNTKLAQSDRVDCLQIPLEPPAE